MAGVLFCNEVAVQVDVRVAVVVCCGYVMPYTCGDWSRCQRLCSRRMTKGKLQAHVAQYDEIVPVGVVVVFGAARDDGLAAGWCCAVLNPGFHGE